MTKKDEEEREESYRRLATVLSPMEKFIAKHDLLSYIEFDYYAVKDLTLFTIEPDLDFPSLQATVGKIYATLPAIKRVFGKPIINLTDTSDVLPVETVRTINQSTLTHLASHTENVANITRRGVKPRKLLTRIYEDDYSIYENVIFCNLVDDTIRYAKHNISALKDLVYANEVMEVNVLERANHLNYYLALGKLQTGYMRDFDKYYGVAASLYSKLQGIIGAIQPRLIKPVYQKNKKRNKDLRLKKTNIFLMQKDYHQVYVLYKWLLSKTPLVEEKAEPLNLPQISSDYFFFVQTLAIFAINNFNFESNPAEKMNMKDLDSTFTFKNWSLRISNVNNEGLLIRVTKNKTYIILLVPDVAMEDKRSGDYFGEEYGADEVVICSPFEERAEKGSSILVSMENIESFRRLQQLVMRGMIYSDTEKADCPFCAGDLAYDGKNDSFECGSCHTEIKEGHCPDTGKSYFYTKINPNKKVSIKRSDFRKDEDWLYDRKVESALYFRNITKINEKGEIVCPYCGKVHQDTKDGK
jgi:hypothetical protein